MQTLEMPPKKKDNKVHPELPLQHSPAAEAVLVTLRYRKKDPRIEFRRESALIQSAAQKLSKSQPPIIKRGKKGNMPNSRESQWNGLSQRAGMNAETLKPNMPRIGPIWDQINKSTLAGKERELKDIEELQNVMQRAQINRALAQFRAGEPLQRLKTGGRVKKTGLVLAHKGELVIPAARVTAVKKAVKLAHLTPLKE